jgi:DUF971 family protein
MNIPLTPIRLDPKPPGKLEIEWNNGDKFEISYVDVRYLCPCASCVDEHTGERTIQLTSISPEIRPTNVQVVGRYAIQFTWSDDHSTGMFHFDRLHQICRERGVKLT